MSFTSQVPVRFAHVDPVGIVFYPRYFEMLNAAVEDWFAAMGADFKTLHLERRLGVPTVKLEAEFIRPGHLGEMLDFNISVERIGGASVTVEFSVTCATEPRFMAKVVLVCMDLREKRSIPWPDDLRTALSLELQDA